MQRTTRTRCRDRKITAVKYLFGLLLTLLFSACTHVNPYDKEDLATTKMLNPAYAQERTFEAHVFPIREGSFGATGGFSGGCGCK